jgi:hypothetical protein
VAKVPHASSDPVGTEGASHAVDHHRRSVRFAAAYAVLTAAHEVGDYILQRDSDAVTKDKHGPEGAAACARHVASYTATQAVALWAADRRFGLGLNWRRAAAGLAVSAVTHYVADRCNGH